MPFDIDQRMLVYLAMITAGIFIFPFYDPPYVYQIIGAALVVVGGVLAYLKSRKSV
jgi:hypothetical protein